MTNRSTQVVTEYGLTNPAHLQRGLDQGDSISPILWCILYDVLISKAEKVYQSCSMKTDYTPDLTNPQIINQISFNVTSITYIDDTIWLSNSKKDMKSIISIIFSFSKLTGIMINAQKSNLLVINPLSKCTQQQVNYRSETLTFDNKSDPIRYLGIWISPNSSQRFQLKQIMNRVNFTFHRLSLSIITDKQLYYVVNSVLVPQILYLTTNLISSPTIIKKLDAKIKLLFKIKCKFKHSTPSAIIYSKSIYNIPNIQDKKYIDKL